MDTLYKELLLHKKVEILLDRNENYYQYAPYISNNISYHFNKDILNSKKLNKLLDIKSKTLILGNKSKAKIPNKYLDMTDTDYKPSISFKVLDQIAAYNLIILIADDVNSISYQVSEVERFFRNEIKSFSETLILTIKPNRNNFKNSLYEKTFRVNHSNDLPTPSFTPPKLIFNEVDSNYSFSIPYGPFPLKLDWGFDESK